MSVWERLHQTPTLSSKAHTHAHRGPPPADSLEWTLRAEYDHEKDLFKDKPDILRRQGQDWRTCQQELHRKKSTQETEWKNKNRIASPDDMNSVRRGAESETGSGPRVVRVRAGDSLTHHLQYTPRPTHTLTGHRAAHGYARNPTGAFFTS